MSSWIMASTGGWIERTFTDEQQGVEAEDGAGRGSSREKETEVGSRSVADQLSAVSASISALSAARGPGTDSQEPRARIESEDWGRATTPDSGAIPAAVCRLRADLCQ